MSNTASPRHCGPGGHGCVGSWCTECRLRNACSVGKRGLYIAQRNDLMMQYPRESPIGFLNQQQSLSLFPFFFFFCRVHVSQQNSKVIHILSQTSFLGLAAWFQQFLQRILGTEQRQASDNKFHLWCKKERKKNPPEKVPFSYPWFHKFLYEKSMVSGDSHLVYHKMTGVCNHWVAEFSNQRITIPGALFKLNLLTDFSCLDLFGPGSVTWCGIILFEILSQIIHFFSANTN